MSFSQTRRFQQRRALCTSPPMSRSPQNTTSTHHRSPEDRTISVDPRHFISLEPELENLVLLLDRNQVEGNQVGGNSLTRQIGIQNVLHEHDAELTITTTRSNFLLINGKRGKFFYLAPRETIWIEIQINGIDSLLQRLKQKQARGKKPSITGRVYLSATFIKTNRSTEEAPPAVVERKISIRLLSGSPKKRDARTCMLQSLEDIVSGAPDYAHNAMTLKHYQEQASPPSWHQRKLWKDSLEKVLHSSAKSVSVDQDHEPPPPPPLFLQLQPPPPPPPPPPPLHTGAYYGAPSPPPPTHYGARGMMPSQQQQQPQQVPQGGNVGRGRGRGRTLPAWMLSGR